MARFPPPFQPLELLDLDELVGVQKKGGALVLQLRDRKVTLKVRSEGGGGRARGGSGAGGGHGGHWVEWGGHRVLRGGLGVGK